METPKSKKGHIYTPSGIKRRATWAKKKKKAKDLMEIRFCRKLVVAMLEQTGCDYLLQRYIGRQTDIVEQLSLSLEHIMWNFLSEQSDYFPRKEKEFALMSRIFDAGFKANSNKPPS